MARYDRFYAWPVIAAGEAMHLERRCRPNAPHDLGRILPAQFLKPIGLLETLDLEPRRKETLDLSFSRVDHILIEPRNLHLAGLGIDAGLRNFHQFRERITRCSSRQTGMGVFRSSSKREPRAQQTSQTTGHGRPPLCDPDGIRHDDRVGTWDGLTILQACGKVRTADFLFQLPEKPNVDWDSLLDGVLRTQESRKRRALVICRTTAMIQSSLVLERKGCLSPFRLLRRLHIHMVIDRNRRMTGSCHPTSGYDRIASRLDNLGISPQVYEDLPCEISHAPDVLSLGRVHADRWNLHHLAEQIFKTPTAVSDIAFKGCTVDHDKFSSDVRRIITSSSKRRKGLLGRPPVK